MCEPRAFCLLTLKRTRDCGFLLNREPEDWEVQGFLSDLLHNPAGSVTGLDPKTVLKEERLY